MIIATKKTATHQFTVDHWTFEGRDFAYVTKQPLNKKTGKAWQATKDLGRFEGDNAKAKAMFAFAKLAK